MLVHWIWLSRRVGLRVSDLRALLCHFSDPEDIYFAQEAELRLVPELGEKALPGLLDKSLTESEGILTACYDKKINVLTLRDGAYPSRLRNIPDPPLVLYYRGTLPAFDSEPAVAVVGTRKASPYGLLVAKRMGYQLAQCGGLVVSGLANGIDAMAMVGALTEGKPVVGVLGCGADVVYPKNQRSLFEDVAARGCILSEYPPGTPPERHHFPRRNRIISGLSCGVLVVEAPESSGALITARHALEQGRDVFTVPANIDVESCAGNNLLLREGAIPVRSGWELLEEYAGRFPGRIHKFTGGEKLTVSQRERIELSEGGSCVAEPKEPETRAVSPSCNGPAHPSDNARVFEASPDEKAVLDALAGKRLPIDEIIAGSELPTARALAALTLLEVRGIVRRLPGKIYVLADDGR